MIETSLLFLALSLILFFGFFSDVVFRKTSIPDILFLILLGFVLGPNVLGAIDSAWVETYAPLFTTFTLLFLLYDGAFNIDLASFAKGLTKSLRITLLYFILSAAVIAGIMHLFGFSITLSVFTGFMLGGVSSAFVIPLLNRLSIHGETYSVLTLESAMTDVLAIVFALGTLEVIKLRAFDLQSLISNLVSLFAVAGLVGICAGILWIVLVKKVFTEHESSMITVAYLLLVFVVTEYLNGNGAIAGLFLGLMLKNARRLTGIFSDITRKNPEPVKAVAVKKASANAVGARKAKNGKKDAATGEQPATPVTTPKEEFFYHQVSFILKTFFFVYIGSLINIYDTRAIVISVLIAVALMVIRVFSSFLLFSFRPFEKQWITSFFARGLAAAAIAQILLLEGIDDAATIANISYGVICFTIILSSLRVFTVKRHALKLQEEAAGASGEK